MEILRSVLRELPEFQQLLAALDSGQSPAAVSGLAAVHRAHFAACLGQESGRPVVVVCADEGEAERMARDLSFLTGGEVPVLAARSFLFHNIATVSRQWEHRRLRLLYRLTRGRSPAWWPPWRPCSSAPFRRRRWNVPALPWRWGRPPTWRN